MLQNAYLLAKIGADTAENEQHFAEILPKIGNYPTGPGSQMPKVDDLQASIEQQEVSGSFTRAELWPYKNLTILKRLTFSLLQIKFPQTNYLWC